MRAMSLSTYHRRTIHFHPEEKHTHCITFYRFFKNVPVRLLGTRFTNPISCFEPGPQDHQTPIILHYYFYIVEIPKPTRVELKCNASGFDVILATPEWVLVSQHRPDAEGLISILKCLKLIPSI
jgi:hypothetical protein